MIILQKKKVHFWIDHCMLYVRDVVTGELAIIDDQKKIAWFLNAHNMTVHDVQGVAVGYDVYNWFGNRFIRGPFSFVQL